MANYTIKSHLDAVMYTLEGNAEAACEAVREICIEAIQNQILYGYHTPHGRDGHTEIVDTGRLFDSINADTRKVSQNAWEVSAGASSEAGRMEDVSYAIFVHDGTARLEGRPFVRDAMVNQSTQSRVERAYVDNLRQGFT